MESISFVMTSIRNSCALPMSSKILTNVRATSSRLSANFPSRDGSKKRLALVSCKRAHKQSSKQILSYLNHVQVDISGQDDFLQITQLEADRAQ